MLAAPDACMRRLSAKDMPREATARPVPGRRWVRSAPPWHVPCVASGAHENVACRAFATLYSPVRIWRHHDHDPIPFASHARPPQRRRQRSCIAARMHCWNRHRSGPGQGRPYHRFVGPVGPCGRSDHTRAAGRDRRDQRSRRCARRPQVRTGAARRRSESGQGRGRGARVDLSREGCGAVRRAGHAGLDGDRAAGESGKDAVRGPLGGRHRHHKKRCESELRLSRLGSGRDCRRRDAELRTEDVSGKKARPDADRQPLG